MAATWTIVIVDFVGKPWPPARALVQVGVPLAIAARYETVRREMSPAGLRRKLRDMRN